MTRLIIFLLAIPVLLAVIILALGNYLQPDDLAPCNNTILNNSKCQAVDAVVAVSGGDTNARTDEAIALYKKGWAPVLIFSGAAEDKTGLSNAAAMKARALAADVPESAIYIDEYSETTRENAENTQTILREHDIRTVILVTSGYHQRRADLEFTARTKDVMIINHPVATDQDWSVWWWTNPRGWSLSLSELFKIIVFHVQEAV